MVLTHGFTLDENGRKMSKSLGNTVEPQKVMKDSGADILRLWVCATDYADDQRIGPEILKNTIETYRKLRNTIRWMLGTLHHFKPSDAVAPPDMPELERLMLHQLAELAPRSCARPMPSSTTRRWSRASSAFMNTELSAFYFDIRKDTLYCDAPSSLARKAALTTIDIICDAILKWLAPVLSFTTDEAWRMYRPDAEPSVHLTLFPTEFDAFRDDALAAKWETIRDVRRVVTGALELERAAKSIGSSLEASPLVYVSDKAIFNTLFDVDLAEVCITSNAMVTNDDAPAGAFTLGDVPGVAVVVEKAVGTKCARSWKILPTVGEDPEYPDVSPRDAQALREWKALGVSGLSPHLRAGVIAAIVTLVLDQASKLWLLFVFDIARRGAVKVTPFFDLVLAWNVGISFGWFQNDSLLAQIVLTAIKAVAVVVLAIWMARSRNLAGHRRARPDHRRRHRQRHRPRRLWRGGRFRPVPRPDRGKNLQLVRV